jgi:hypothetical protein
VNVTTSCTCHAWERPSNDHAPSCPQAPSPFPQPAAGPTGELRRLCEKTGRYEIGALPADRAAGPTGEGRAEATEQVWRTLAERLNPRTGMSERAVSRLADAVLAVPAIREALEAAEKVRRVLAEHQPVPAEDVGPGGPYPRAMCSCGESFYDDCEVRRALAGRDGDRQEGEGQ